MVFHFKKPTQEKTIKIKEEIKSCSNKQILKWLQNFSRQVVYFFFEPNFRLKSKKKFQVVIEMVRLSLIFFFLGGGEGGGGGGLKVGF